MKLLLIAFATVVVASFVAEAQGYPPRRRIPWRPRRFPTMIPSVLVPYFLCQKVADNSTVEVTVTNSTNPEKFNVTSEDFKKCLECNLNMEVWRPKPDINKLLSCLREAAVEEEQANGSTTVSDRTSISTETSVTETTVSGDTASPTDGGSSSTSSETTTTPAPTTT